ncbi:MAG: poly(3-hydroxybutyrate) depolymerase [bacterium]|jgi:polyhydroxybutyrate depolymerase|nr:poly(3-hydroxybutyrate) depolymerase [Gammaproteobacteria bacterium]HIL84387.1 poly(3-hydroxybutyrate) depolymerase [Pseudomonadales bacterium]
MPQRTGFLQRVSIPVMVYLTIAFAIVGVLTYLYLAYTFSDETIAAVDFVYPSTYVSSCDSSPGMPVNHSLQNIDGTVSYNVTTPLNYRRDFAHPLLMVWAPNGFSAFMSERYTGLTRDATEQGFVVVHASSIRLGLKSIEVLGQIPLAVMAQWCIDPALVFYTGHSDGGTVSTALTVMDDLSVHPRAIAPSAMGMRGQDMEAFSCPVPTSIMLMHNQDDGHFPGFGADVIKWWAKCNQCAAGTVPTVLGNCKEFVGCADGSVTLLCEPEGSHMYWPGHELDPVAFFAEIVNSSQPVSAEH